MKRVAILIFGLILISFAWQGLSEASLKLYIEDQEVALQHPLLMVNGNIMIPVQVLQNYLGARVEYKTSEGRISVMFPDQTIIMHLGEESALVGGQSFKLDVAPQVANGETMVPLRFFADHRDLSLVFVQELMALRLEGSALAAQAEEIVFHQPQIEQHLQEIIYMGGPRSRVYIDLEAYTGYQTNLLVDPDRLVIDLYGVSGEPLPEQAINDVLVKKIRSSRFDQQTLRIVFDLNKSTGYQINPWPEGGLEVEFNYQLSDLGFTSEGDQAQLWLEISAQPLFSVMYLQDPHRLVIDLQDTTWLDTARSIAVEHERIERIRVNQHLPAVTRIVLDLQKPVALLPCEKMAQGFVFPLFPGTEAEANTFLASLTPEAKPAQKERAPEVGEGSLAGLTIVVDPGHGGSDPGTIGYQGTFEKDVALAIGKFLGQYLKEAGAKVVFTREKDVYVSIFERPEIAIKSQADIFVSVHANSHLKRGTVRGTETLYRAGDEVSRLLAESIQKELVKAITLIDRRIWPRNDLAVFNGSTIPAVLVEVGFLDHPDEEVLLKAAGFQQVAAEGIFKGIECFLDEVKKAGEGE